MGIYDLDRFKNECDKRRVFSAEIPLKITWQLNTRRTGNNCVFLQIVVTVFRVG